MGIFLCALCERRVSVLEFQSPLLIYSALIQRNFFVQLISLKSVSSLLNFKGFF